MSGSSSTHVGRCLHPSSATASTTPGAHSVWPASSGTTRMHRWSLQRVCGNWRHHGVRVEGWCSGSTPNGRPTADPLSDDGWARTLWGLAHASTGCLGATIAHRSARLLAALAGLESPPSPGGCPKPRSPEWCCSDTTPASADGTRLVEVNARHLPVPASTWWLDVARASPHVRQRTGRRGDARRRGAPRRRGRDRVGSRAARLARVPPDEPCGTPELHARGRSGARRSRRLRSAATRSVDAGRCQPRGLPDQRGRGLGRRREPRGSMVRREQRPRDPDVGSRHGEPRSTGSRPAGST